MTPRTICVLGMHRSGTSCLTGTLEEAGVCLGEVATHSPHNLKGNREHPQIMALHEDLLARAGGSWCDPPRQVRWEPRHRTAQREILAACGARTPWGFKDPRTLLVWEGWADVLDDVALVGIYRSPLAVARSLEKRNGMTIAQGLQLWEAYNRRLLDLRRQHAFPVVRFDVPEEQLRARFAAIIEWLGLPPGRGEFFAPELRHQSGAAEDPLPDSTVDLIAALEAAERESMPSDCRSRCGRTSGIATEVQAVSLQAAKPRRPAVWSLDYWVQPSGAKASSLELERPLLDQPMAGASLPLAGWVSSTNLRLRSLTVLGSRGRLACVPLVHETPGRYRFDTVVHLEQSALRENLKLAAVDGFRRSTCLAVLEVHRTPLASSRSTRAA